MKAAVRYVFSAVLVGVVALGGVAPGQARASSGSPTFAVARGCVEHQAFLDGDAAGVAARLPRRYSPVIDDSSGQPLVFARAIRCDRFEIGGRSVAVTMASFGVVVNSPDGSGCGSGAPVAGQVKGDVPPLCNWYTMLWLATSRDVVKWLATGTDWPAVFAPHLTFSLGALDPTMGGAPFHFQAPSSTPSPFRIDAVARERPGELAVRGGYWADTDRGTVKVAFSTEDLTSGDATGVVGAAPGSALAAILGTTERPYAEAYSAVSAERWANAAYQKQASTPGDGSGFAGTCSVQGDVHFSPPATDTPAALTYDYPASGTCSGSLDDQQVSNVPVTLDQSGRSAGSCLHAQTTGPGVGVLSFGKGRAISYTLDFTTVGTEVFFTFEGQHGGAAHAHGTFLTKRTPSDTTQRCASGGVSVLPMDMTMTTDSPLA